MPREKLPIITENSEISRIAVRQFLGALPGRWTASEPNEGDDYGIDVTVHIAEGAHPSGRLSHVQIKGTRADEARAKTFRVKETTLNHLRSMADAAVLLRTQIDLHKSWLIHIHDGRTMRPADNEGWVHIKCDDDDLVSDLSLHRRLSKLSYRKRWQATRDGEFRLQVAARETALTLHSMFGPRLPKNLTFSSADPDDASVQGEAEVTSTNLVLRDYATTLVRDQRISAPPVALMSLAAFLGQAGAWSLAVEIFASAADVIDDATFETLTPEEEHHLLDVLLKHATDEQLLEAAGYGLANGCHWAGRWFASFVLNRAVQNVQLQLIDRAFAVWPDFETNVLVRLLKANVLARYGYDNECRQLVNPIALDAVTDPASLFELGLLSAQLKLFAKARGAWRAASRAGYDALSCRLETTRSYFAEGNISEALKSAPKRGQPKDARNEALFELFQLFGRIFQERAIKKILGDMSMLNHALALLLAKQEAERDSGSALLICAVTIIRALRDEHDIDAWSLALEHGIRAKVPAPLIDAIVRLAGAVVGGEPLRRAAVRLHDAHQIAVLERWHKRIDDLQGANLVRRREDFVMPRVSKKSTRKSTNTK